MTWPEGCRCTLEEDETRTAPPGGCPLHPEVPEVVLAGELDNPPTGYPGVIRLVGDDIVKPWRYKGP